jgi:hypothetical protein
VTETIFNAAFNAAVKVTSAWGLSAFIAAIVLCALYLSMRNKSKPVPMMAWIVLVIAIVVPSLGGLVRTFVQDPLYHVRVTVLDSENRSISNAEVSTDPFGVMKQVGNAWEAEISKATVPSGGTLQVRAEADSADGRLSGTQTVTLGSDSNVSVSIVLQAPRNARISGIVIDDSVGNAIANARVSVVGHGNEEKPTDSSGFFDLDAHVARGQPVLLHTQAEGFLPDNQQYLAGGRVTVRLKPAPRPKVKRR